MDAEITTARLRLRRGRPGDLDEMHALVSPYEVVSHTGTWPHPAERAFTASRCEPVAPERGMAGPVFAGDTMIGIMGVLEAEMGYMIGREHWGKGYATEIGRALIAHAWQSYDWPAISACVFTDNPASVRVLEKLGFEEGARCEGACRARLGRFPTRTFRLARPVSCKETGPNSL